MPKPTPQELSALAEQIRAAAAVICGNCAIAALALIQAQAKQEAHVLADHQLDTLNVETFEADVGRLQATAARGLEKARALRGAGVTTNSAGGSC